MRVGPPLQALLRKVERSNKVSAVLQLPGGREHCRLVRRNAAQSFRMGGSVYAIVTGGLALCQESRAVVRVNQLCKCLNCATGSFAVFRVMSGVASVRLTMTPGRSPTRATARQTVIVPVVVTVSQ